MLNYLSMENNSDLSQSLKDIKKVANNTSWFRDTPHYWAQASLPLAYAVACVEVVCKSSESELHAVRSCLDTANTTQAKTVSEMPLSLLE